MLCYQTFYDHSFLNLEKVEEIASFDAILIDADKIAYPAYLQHAKRLLRKGGLLIADNTLLFNLVLSDQPPLKNPELWTAMCNFNEMLAIDQDFEALIIPTLEGLSIALKK